MLCNTSIAVWLFGVSISIAVFCLGFCLGIAFPLKHIYNSISRQLREPNDGWA